MTLEQIRRYYEELRIIKREDLRNSIYANVMAFGFAGGTIKKKDFMDFVDTLDTKKKNIDVSKTIDKLKRSDISVEEK